MRSVQVYSLKHLLRWLVAHEDLNNMNNWIEDITLHSVAWVQAAV
jgi:hypothetical protein